MYTYDAQDRAFVTERAAEFRDQVERRLNGQLDEHEFKPLRLKNGLYLQLHGYMLRVAIPYGTLSSTQMHKLAELAATYDRGYGHFTTRQNIQYNWPKLSDVPDMIDELARVDMHAIQTSGNCIRNVTADPFAGVAADEFIDPRPTAELLRQWSSAHPEFAYLPRKFKFAVTGAAQDRAAMKFHDIGLEVRSTDGVTPTFNVWVGGGQGRTPRVAQLFEQDVALEELLPLLDSILRVYNLYGRRDNKYKARIKILVTELGLEPYRDEVRADLALQSRAPFAAAAAEYQRIAEQFRADDLPAQTAPASTGSSAFNGWVKTSVSAHKVDGYAVVSVSLKPDGGIPGDATAAQMHALADLAEQFSFSELRITHRQNVVLPSVPSHQLAALHSALIPLGLAEDNIDAASDIICCPGLDYCALATARSIPVAQELSRRLRARERHENLNGLTINISGCINACGHHHAANIGILGLNKTENETYQISLAGRHDENAQVGEILGPGFSQAALPEVIDKLIDVYQAHRAATETFDEVYARVGKQAFKDAVYVSA